VAALVRLLGPLDVAAPAVRTAVSRMVRQGWLRPVRLVGGAGYQLTPRAVLRMDETAARVYRTGQSAWDGRFDLVVLTPPTDRAERARIVATLGFLGYGQLHAGVWLAPRAADEIDALLTEAGVRYERFAGTHAAGAGGSATLVRRAWDLDSIGKDYQRFVEDLRPELATITERSPDDQAYVARFRLVHAWRTFLFRDPGLPPALLPPRWPGTAAAAFFDRHQARLRPAADRYVDRCLDPQS
jgi:phenylacetic acid degradation operon negative regulatory protein